MAQLKNTSFSDNGFLKLPSGNTGQRPSNPESGYTRFNTDLNAVEVYSNTGWTLLNQELDASVTGDVDTKEIYQNGKKYRVHVFKGTGTFTPNAPGKIEYLIVAGGGAGGRHHGGGGGAGGLLQGTTTVTPQQYTLSVGAGGSPNTGTNSNPGGNGGNGGNSTAFGLTAIGGGGGSNYSDDGAGNGGSGGGAQTWTQGRSGGLGTIGQGFDGGDSDTTQNTGGGGGGAGEPGGQAPAGNGGGAGVASEITGQRIYYAGGGNAGVYNDGTGRPNNTASGTRGFGGGGYMAPTSHSSGRDAKPGGINSGGGGAGNAEYTSPGGAGGSGVIIVRYRIKNDPTDIQLDTNTQPVTRGLFLHLDPAKLSCYNYGEYTVARDLTTKSGSQAVTPGSGVNVEWSTEGNGSWYFGTYPAYFNTEGYNTINNIERFTLSCWLRKTTTQDAFLILGTRFGNNTDQSLAIIGGNLCLHKYSFNSSSDLNVASGSTNLNDDTWHYCAITYDAGDTKTYVDGQLDGTENHVNTTTDSDNLQINYNSNVNQTYRFYIGYIGPVLVYDRVLTQPELERNFEAYRRRYGV